MWWRFVGLSCPSTGSLCPISNGQNLSGLRTNKRSSRLLHLHLANCAACAIATILLVGGSDSGSGAQGGLLSFVDAERRSSSPEAVASSSSATTAVSSKSGGGNNNDSNSNYNNLLHKSATAPRPFQSEEMIGDLNDAFETTTSVTSSPSISVGGGRRRQREAEAVPPPEEEEEGSRRRPERFGH